MKIINQKTLQVGSVLFILAGSVYLACEKISAWAWSNPSYQYSQNYISDLGIPVVTQFMGRMINSPLHNVMNFGFFTHGVLFVIAYFMIIHTLSTKMKFIGLTLAVIHGVGIILVGAFPGYDWWGEPYHGIGALLAIVTGNLAILSGGMLARKLFMQRWCSILSVLLSIIGIISFAIFIGVDDNVYAAVFERTSVYTIIAWDIIFGLFVLVRSRKINEVNGL